MPQQPFEPFVFSGSLVDGPSIDLIKIAGLDLNDQDCDRLWNTISPIELLDECDCVDKLVVGENDEFPGQSDQFYQYEATSLDRLKSELRSVINSRLSKD